MQGEREWLGKSNAKGVTVTYLETPLKLTEVYSSGIIQGMIYTGYYAKLKTYQEAGLIPISIAGKAPAFFDGIQYKVFAPSWSIFSRWKSGEINDLGYTKLFKTQILDKLNKEEVKTYLNSFQDDIILLCYEKSGDFCHRHIVADWIESELNIRVDEYPV